MERGGISMTNILSHFSLNPKNLECSLEDKLECLQTVKKLSGYSRLARSEGLLALEEPLSQEKDTFLKQSLLPILDGIGNEQYLHLITTYFLSGNYHGKDFLNNLLIIESIPLIEDCVRPDSLVFLLKGWFGIEFTEIYEKEMEEEKLAWNKKIALEAQKRNEKVH